MFSFDLQPRRLTMLWKTINAKAESLTKLLPPYSQSFARPRYYTKEIKLKRIIPKPISAPSYRLAAVLRKTGEFRTARNRYSFREQWLHFSHKIFLLYPFGSNDETLIRYDYIWSFLKFSLPSMFKHIQLEHILTLKNPAMHFGA